jgi:hypothetical protein
MGEEISRRVASGTSSAIFFYVTSRHKVSNNNTVGGLWKQSGYNYSTLNYLGNISFVILDILLW